jgi:hypothetical protein
MSETPTPKPQPIPFKDWQIANREFEENERVRKEQEGARIKQEIENSADKYLGRFWVAAKDGLPVLSGEGYFIAADEDVRIFQAIERKLRDSGWNCTIRTSVKTDIDGAEYNRTELWVVP